MCPIDIYFEVDDPRFGEKRLLKTLNPGGVALGFPCSQTGVTMVVECDPNDNGGTIMRRLPREQNELGIVSLDAQGVPTAHVSARDLVLDRTITPNGTQTFSMFNYAGESCEITCKHR